MRAAIYARLSSDLQDVRSIVDQVAMARRYAGTRGPTIAAVYEDAAISGASILNRPGLQRLLKDAEERRIDVVLTESLDRLSRSQADIAALYERLSFYGTRIETLADGVVSEIHVGLKGTMAALPLKDLAQKTRRGQVGRANLRDGPIGCIGGYDEEWLASRPHVDTLAGKRPGSQSCPGPGSANKFSWALQMRRADRLFDIIQALRSAKKPLTAQVLAGQLEVTPRTIYRDIATLQAHRVPVEGAVGVGYVLRRGYDLPPLMFTDEEVEAIAVGVRMVRRLRDDNLHGAAESVLAKIALALPSQKQKALAEPRIWVSDGDAKRPSGVDLSEVRSAIRSVRKLLITYLDEGRKRSRRTILPIAMVYYVDVTLIAAWCELRSDFRHFRVDRIRSCTVLDERFIQESERHMAQWLTLRDGARADQY